MNYRSGTGRARLNFDFAAASASECAAQTGKTESHALYVSIPITSTGVAAFDDANVSTAASLVTQALMGSDVRTEKVSAIQQSIAAGDYSVSPSEMAGTLVNALLGAC